jgi:hypothetical protein
MNAPRIKVVLILVIRSKPPLRSNFIQINPQQQIRAKLLDVLGGRRQGFLDQEPHRISQVNADIYRII